MRKIFLSAILLFVPAFLYADPGYVNTLSLRFEDGQCMSCNSILKSNANSFGATLTYGRMDLAVYTNLSLFSQHSTKYGAGGEIRLPFFNAHIYAFGGLGYLNADRGGTTVDVGIRIAVPLQTAYAAYTFDTLTMSFEHDTVLSNPKRDMNRVYIGISAPLMRK